MGAKPGSGKAGSAQSIDPEVSGRVRFSLVPPLGIGTF